MLCRRWSDYLRAKRASFTGPLGTGSPRPAKDTLDSWWDRVAGVSQVVFLVQFWIGGAGAEDET